MSEKSSATTRAISRITALVAVLLGALFFAPAATAATPPANTQPIGVTAGIETHAGEGTNHFATYDTSVDWQSGNIVLAGTRNGLGRTAVDDYLKVIAYRPDGTQKLAFEVDYSNGCTSDGPQPFQPWDLSPALEPGLNRLVFQFYDRCGGYVSSSPLWVVPHPKTGAYTDPPPRNPSTATPDFSISGGYGSETNLNIATNQVTQENSFGTNYTSGPFKLAKSEAGTGAVAIHGKLELEVFHNDGTSSTGYYGQTGGCSTSETVPPTNVASLFEPGFNQVVAYFLPTCGSPYYNTAMWLARA